MPSFYRQLNSRKEHLRKFNTLLIITLIYALMSWATPSLNELGQNLVGFHGFTNREWNLITFVHIDNH
jgi:hypothetical protein